LEKSAKLWMLNGRTMGKLLGLRAKSIRPYQLFDLKKLRLQSIEVRSKNVLPAYCMSSLWTLQQRLLKVSIGVSYKSDHRIIRWTNCRRLIGSSVRSGGASRKRFEKARTALPRDTQ
jgi:hypothetical protein